jgi:hypothetical protein
MGDSRHKPGWEPPSDDVVFDHGLAAEAAHACRRAAVVAGEVGQTRAQAGVVTSKWFRGVFAEIFTGRHEDAVEMHLQIAAALDTLAGRIESSAIAASEEQAHRENLREQWEAEYRRNEALAEMESNP